MQDSVQTETGEALINKVAIKFKVSWHTAWVRVQVGDPRVTSWRCWQGKEAGEPQLGKREDGEKKGKKCQKGDRRLWPYFPKIQPSQKKPQLVWINCYQTFAFLRRSTSALWWLHWETAEEVKNVILWRFRWMTDAESTVAVHASPQEGFALTELPYWPRRFAQWQFHSTGHKQTLQFIQESAAWPNCSPDSDGNDAITTIY